MRMEKAVFEIVTIYRKGQDLMSKAVGFVSKDVAGEKKKTYFHLVVPELLQEFSKCPFFMYIIYSFLVQMVP